MGHLRWFLRRLNRRGATPAPPVPLKVSDILDDLGYVLQVPAAYTGFATANPTVAFYLEIVAAGAFTLSNRLAKQGH